MSIQAKQFRILPNDVYNQLMGLLKTKDKVSRFTMEDGVLHEQLRTQKAPCIPFSAVKQQVPTEFADFEIGEGEKVMAEILQTIGMTEEEARGTAYTLYKHITPWVILPTSIIEKIPSQMKGDRVFLEPGTFAKADAFAKWITEFQILEPEEPKPKPVLSEESRVRRAALRAHAATFQESYLLMSDETYEGWYAVVKEKPGKTYTKKLSIYKEPVVYRIDETGRMFAACGDFTKEKEVLSSTIAQPHLPEELRGYGFGDGPDVLFAGLRQRGMEKEEASEIAQKIYEIIPTCVILPTASIDTMAVSIQNGVLMTDATLLNKAFDMYEWLNEK